MARKSSRGEIMKRRNSERLLDRIQSPGREKNMADTSNRDKGAVGDKHPASDCIDLETARARLDEILSKLRESDIDLFKAHMVKLGSSFPPSMTSPCSHWLQV